jgi:membrane peptidoglycan carboxypeptidase
MVGLPDALETAKNLGITTLDRNADRYGLTLVLGGGEVSLLDMTSVYSVFANEGVRNPETGILEIDDANGNVLEKYSPAPQTVMDPNATRNLSSVLSDNVSRTPLYGPNSFFYFGSRQVAGKTGTTNNNKDAWVFGYTPSITVGVWSGNNNNTPMSKGSSISGPAWRAFMDYALTKVPYSHPGETEVFNTSDAPLNYMSLAPVLRGAWAGGESFFIDSISGKLATDLTPKETLKEIVVPNPHNILYWINPSNPTGPRLDNPAKSSQYNRWETEFQSWIANHPEIVPPYPIKPIENDDVHTAANKPTVSIISPVPGVILTQNNPVTVQLDVMTHFPVKNIDWYLNDVFIGSNSNTSFSFIPANTGSQVGTNSLKIVVTDTSYNQGEITTTLNFQ